MANTKSIKPTDSARPVLLGTTLSVSQLLSLGIEKNSGIKDVFSLGFDIVRISAVWSQIEARPGDYDFSDLILQLETATHARTMVVVTLGMKAPRWPEFHFPAWITPDPSNTSTQAAALAFIAATIQACQQYICISHWQVENEPFDHSGPENQIVHTDFLAQEIALVRQHDPRPILVTLWGNQLSRRGHLQAAAALGDVVGIDLYPKSFAARTPFGSIYSGPRDSYQKLHQLTSRLAQPIWIAELQAEPWEGSSEAYRSDSPGSMSPEQLYKNTHLALSLSPAAILFWGVEYWLWQSHRGNTAYLDTYRQIATEIRR